MNQTNLNAIAAEILKDCPAESLADHEKAAAALREGDAEKALAAVDAWPESYSWLKGELAAA